MVQFQQAREVEAAPLHPIAPAAWRLRLRALQGGLAALLGDAGPQLAPAVRDRGTHFARLVATTAGAGARVHPAASSRSTARAWLRAISSLLGATMAAR